MIYRKLIISILLVFITTFCSGPGRGNEGNDSGWNDTGKGMSDPLTKRLEMANCFLYHRFNEGKYPSTNISAALFESQLKYLVNHHIPVITLGDFLRLKPGENKPERYVILTIDDAFKSFYRYGYPLLKKYELTATLFVNTETIGSGDYLDWVELKQLLDYGIEIGNHTHSHDYFLNQPSDARVENFKMDVEKAQNIFKNHLNYNCEVFAYPFGEYDPNMKKVIRNLGFLGAVAQNSGVISEFSDLFALPRFPMTDQFGQMDRFTEKVNINPLPVTEVIPSNTLSEINPPVLRIRFENKRFDLGRLQCFVQGSDCVLTVLDPQSVVVEIKANNKLSSRRHLYTLTVPQIGTSKWYWFSHQWIFPDRP
jgi:peptidoglycan/xylan/chitin deacetylase (PgdA/CDA1 family)